MSIDTDFDGEKCFPRISGYDDSRLACSSCLLTIGESQFLHDKKHEVQKEVEVTPEMLIEACTAYNTRIGYRRDLADPQAMREALKAVLNKGK